MPKKVAVLLAAGTLLYAAACAYLYLNQDNLIFHPTREWASTPKKIDIEYEDVSFISADGLKLSGWFVEAKSERGVILFCHGNSRNISAELAPLKMFHDLGFSMLLFDYRGYGKSEGKPSEVGMLMDAQAAWDYLTLVKKIPPSRLIVQGRSLGAGVAIPLAVKVTPRALLVDASFKSLADVAAKRYPIFPVRLLLKSRFDSLKNIARIQCPVLITHSKDDQIIPFEQGLALYHAAPSPKVFNPITGPHDNKDVPESQVMYRAGVEKFLNSIFAKG